MQNDNNVVLYNSQGKALWNSNTAGKGMKIGRLVFQCDGNLVLYDAANSVLWANQKFESMYLIMQNDGNLVNYKSNGGAAWYTATT